jgi:adenosylmethionine-8-amino-7-oxononanoate aminotransferase
MRGTGVDDELLAWDREHLWHPYTSMSDPSPVRLVTGAHGVHLSFADGSRVIDAMASWWSAIHGYNHPGLNRAVTDQLDSMAHVMFGGLTHEPAVRLGQRLVDLTPDGLEHVFLADSGSVSVEVALKMVLQYQRGLGRPQRTRMLTVLGGYHGDTCGCMGVCDPDGGMHSMFRGFVPEHVFVPRPPPLGADIEEWVATVRTAAAVNADQLAGIIVEPLLQGAGGMWPYPAACLQVLREVADELELVLVFDEIATGFGRTGAMFAADASGVTPDIMCVGKALTGGYLTLAAVLCTTAVAHGLSGSESGVLMHGPTYMGNPLACAVALANLDLLTSVDWAANIRRISARLVAGLAPAGDLSGVLDIRTLGAVGIIQLDRPVDVVAATDVALAAGVWIRPFRDLIYTMPPYISTDAELDTICTALRAAAVAR